MFRGFSRISGKIRPMIIWGGYIVGMGILIQFLVYALGFALAMLLIVRGAFIMGKQTTFKVRPGYIPATITGYVSLAGKDFQNGAGEPDTHAPQYRYQVDGQWFEGLGPYRMFKIGHVGMTIPVEVDPNDPRHSRIASQQGPNKVWGIVYIVVGVFVLMAGALLGQILGLILG